MCPYLPPIFHCRTKKYFGFARGVLSDDNKSVKRRDPQFIGPKTGLQARPGVPAVTLALSVLLCIGALSDGSAAAAAVAQSLGRHATTASERDSVAALLSNLNEAARKLCRIPSGQVANFSRPHAEMPLVDQPTALRAYQSVAWVYTCPAIGEHLLNLPPPSATF